MTSTCRWSHSFWTADSTAVHFDHCWDLCISIFTFLSLFLCEVVSYSEPCHSSQQSKAALVTQLGSVQLTVVAEYLTSLFGCEEKVIRGHDKLELCICWENTIAPLSSWGHRHKIPAGCLYARDQTIFHHFPVLPPATIWLNWWPRF